MCNTKICPLFRSAVQKSTCTPTWMENGIWMRARCGGSWWSSWCRLWSGSKLCMRSTRGHRARRSLTPTRSVRESSSAPHFKSVTGRPSQVIHMWKWPLIKTDNAEMWTWPARSFESANSLYLVCLLLCHLCYKWFFLLMRSQSVDILRFICITWKSMLNSDTESPAPFVLNTANLHIICKKKKKNWPLKPARKQSGYKRLHASNSPVMSNGLFDINTTVNQHVRSTIHWPTL